MRLAALVLCLLSPHPPAQPAPVSGPAPTGLEIVQQMRKKYDGKWYRTATFVQKTTKGDGSVETWYEALEIPSKLRIDIAPLDSGKAIFFRADSIYVIEGGKIKNSGPFVHPLLILGFDVYLQEPAETARRLTAIGYDLNTVSEGTWRGKPVWIVGAQAGDSTKKQFWIEKDRLLFVRSTEVTAKGRFVETVFDGYQKLGGGWIETLVDFNIDGVSKQKEEYSSPRAEVKLPEELFDPAKWAKAEWIGKQ
jgi:hypothetical protein